MDEHSDNGQVVEAKELTKVFRDFWHRPKVRAVNKLSFDVQRGEVFGLLGPNGSGKTTTLKMILGLLFPTQGLLQVLGRSPREVKTKARVGYLPEESYLYPYLSSEETLDFYGRLFDLNRRERKQRTDQLLQMIGLEHARHRMVGEFSKGMARRIGLAQALINDPDLVVLDEPTSGLDPIGCRQVKDLILTLARRGKTVILSSHLLADVEDVCDRIAILYNGQFKAVGPINDLLEERDRFVLTVPQVEPEVMKRILTTIRQEIGAEPEVEHPRRDLEQYFIDVVQKARQAVEEESGVSSQHQEVAHYLSQTEERNTDEALSHLVRSDADHSTGAAVPVDAEANEDVPPPISSEEADRKLSRFIEPDEGDQDRNA